MRASPARHSVGECRTRMPLRALASSSRRSLPGCGRLASESMLLGWTLPYVHTTTRISKPSNGDPILLGRCS
jgi:hypothetical protein